MGEQESTNNKALEIPERPIMPVEEDAFMPQAAQTSGGDDQNRSPGFPDSIVDSSARIKNAVKLAFPFDPPIEIVDIERHNFPYDPYDSAANARRVELLAERETGPLDRLSQVLSKVRELRINEHRTYGDHLRDYADVLGIRGTPPKDIARFKTRADRRYSEAPPHIKERMEKDMKRNLELLIESDFDVSLNIVADLLADAGKSQDIIERFREGTRGEFEPASRKTKTATLRTLAKKRKDLLISNYGIYLRIWQDLNPNGANAQAKQATFAIDGSDRAQQLLLAEKLYAEVHETVNQRALAYTSQWRQLTIDQGLPPEMADEQALLLTQDATTGPLAGRMIRMQEIRAMTEELLLKTFGISSRLWTEMTTGELGAQFDMDSAFSPPHLSIDDRVKLAKGIYRKIDKQLKTASTRLFAHLANILRERGKLGEWDITLKINKREAQLKSLSRLEQYRRITGWSKAIGLEPIPIPSTSTS